MFSWGEVGFWEVMIRRDILLSFVCRWFTKRLSDAKRMRKPKLLDQNLKIVNVVQQ